MGEGSLELYAASAEAKIRDILDNERRQTVVANTLLNIVLVGALAVGVVVALRLLGNLARKAQRFVHQNPDRIPAIRLQSIEVVGPHVFRSAIVVGVGIAKFVLQFALVYVWLVFSSSLFEVTRGLAGNLTSLVLSPLGGLMSRLAALLPLVLVTTIAVIVLFVLLRFIALFFESVQRKETELSWLKPELAAPTSLLTRVAVVVIAMLFLAPVVTGNLDGALTRLGMLFVVTAALASTPLLANIVVGLVTLYGQRLREGDRVELSTAHEPGLRGHVVSLGLLELEIQSESGRRIRVAHLSTLLRPIAIESPERAQQLCRLRVRAKATGSRLVTVVEQALSERKLNYPVELLRLSAEVATLDILAKGVSRTERQALLVVIASTLAAEEMPLVLAEWQDIP
jgi:hypothetical protein